MANQFSNMQESIAAAQTSIDNVAADLHSQATKIQELMDQIEGGLTAEEAAAVNAQLATLRDNAQAAANIIDPAVEPGENPPVEPTP